MAVAGYASMEWLCDLPLDELFDFLDKINKAVEKSREGR